MAVPLLSEAVPEMGALAGCTQVPRTDVVEMPVTAMFAALDDVGV